MKKYTEEITKLDIMNIGFNKFKEDYVIRNSISMDIMQIGELVKYLSKEFIERTKQKVNWKDINGMRNYFAHGYISMDYQIIYNTALYDIPKLQNFLNTELENLLHNKGGSNGI